MRILFLGILIACCQQVYGQQQTVFGHVIDAATSEVLIGANVYNPIENNGVATNQYGFFSYSSTKKQIELRVSYIGYRTKTFSFTLISDTSLTISLNRGDELDEVVVLGEQMNNTRRLPLSTAQIKSVPRLGGEVDVLKAFHLLPGVQSGIEGSSGAFVRGGSPDQNLILLDGVPVYNASHLFGFISVFNAEAINNVHLVKDGFPARYGGRLSSVIDITLKEGNIEEPRGYVSLSPVASSLTVDGPINSKTSFLLSGRRTFIDLIARPFIRAQSDGEDDGGYYFYDVNLKLNHRISSKDRIYLSTYIGNDRGFTRSNSADFAQSGFSTGFDVFKKTESRYELEWGNRTSALRWNHIYGPRLFSNVTITHSNYNYRVFESLEESKKQEGEIELKGSEISYASGIEDLALKIDYVFHPNTSHTFRFGGSAISHDFEPGILAYSTQANQDTTLGDQQIRAFEYYIYGEDEFVLSSKLTGNLGLHLSAFATQDELYTSFEPRVTFSYSIQPNLLWRASYARMKQYIHLLTNSGVGLPTDLWVPSTNRVLPQAATQYSMGVETALNSTELSVDGFYKSMNNLIEYEEGASYLSVEKNWQDKIVTGEGEAYGAEFLIKQSGSRWNGWVGYSLSWNNRRFNELNDGEQFPYRYDRRHDVNIVYNYQPKKGVQYSASWVYHSGNAITLASKQFAVKTESELNPVQRVSHFEGRNSFRMPAYHRLDISATWTRPIRFGLQSWTVSVYNTYNRKNPFYIELENREVFNAQLNQFENSPRYTQYSLFPIIPSFNYSLAF